MRKMKKILGLLLAILLLVGQLPGTIGTVRAAQDDEFLYPKLSYSNSEGIRQDIITMGSVNYLVYTITQDGTLTIDGNYLADIWLAGGGANGQAGNGVGVPSWGGGGGYTTNVVNMVLRSGDITIGPGGGGTTTYAYDDPLNPGQPRFHTAAGGNGANGGSGGGKGGKGQGRSTRPFGASEMPAYCQGGWSSNYNNPGNSTYPSLEPGSDGGDGSDFFGGRYCWYSNKNDYIPATGTGGVGGGLGSGDSWTVPPGNDATAYGSGGSGGSEGGKGYQGAMMIRIALSSLHPADYAPVNAAIAWANSLPRENYKDFTPVINAINAVDRTKVASEQAQVNAMATAITAAVNSLESTGADYSMVDQLYAHALALKSSDYEDFSGVIAALAAVNRDKSIEQQAEVNTMAKNIFMAINALVPLPADYTAVDAALAAISRLPDPSYYVTMEGLTAAKGIVVRGKTKSQQADVDAMYMTLINAIESLQLKPADYTLVDTNILRAAELDAGSYKNFDTVVMAARSVERDKNILEQPEVDMMATSLMAAIDNLELIDADYAGVDLAIRYAQGLDPRNYTNFNAVSTAITAVVRGKSIAEQDLVDEMAADIVEAILSLQRTETATTPTPTPSSGNTTPTPTPYNSNTSNGVTLEQLQDLLNKNKATPTPYVSKLGLPKTGDQDIDISLLRGIGTLAVCVGGVGLVVIIIFGRIKRRK